MRASQLKSARQAAGLSQAELATRAGVSRQLVGAVESGRHLPRVDSAMALAGALGSTVADLFATPAVPVDIVTGQATSTGAFVRAGRIAGQVVTAPIRISPEGWDAADGVVTSTGIETLAGGSDGIVVGGCEPSLFLLEQMLRERGMGAVAVSLTSAAALTCLLAGRLHAAVVHGSETDLRAKAKDISLHPFHLARWQVGIAAGPGAATGWWKEALAGRVAVVQREPGAGVQRAFVRALPKVRQDVPGPVAGSHIEAGRLGMAMGIPAVTIEPAARSLGAAFHPIEVHSAQLWIPGHLLDDAVVEAAMATLLGSRFQAQLAAVGGYDLIDSGNRAA